MIIALALALQDVDKVRDALLRAADAFRGTSKHGGYVWRVSVDGTERFGEGRAGPDQIWVQPPGTPAVGLAFLRAYAAVKEPPLLEAATAAGRALAKGRLKSGGWTYSIDFTKPGRNYTTFDDDTTQCALRFLAELDRVLDFKDAAIHQAVEGAVDALLKAQFPNGAFPQGFDRPVPAHPVVPAAFPAGDWRELPRVKEYWNLYTLNDGLAGRMTETLLALHRVYGRKDVLAALEKLGDFLLLARCPEPQPAWAQQYDVEMRPAWARKFEPPAVSGWESMDVCEALMAISEATKNPKYLEPVGPALAYLRKSLRPDGRLARFHELKTNRPLYLTRDYQVVYTDDDLPTHYGFHHPPRLDELERELARVKAGAPRKASKIDVRPILESLDAKGFWTEGGRWIHSATFVKNLDALSDVLRGK